MGNIITGVIRKAMRDVEIKGYLIPKGWCVFTYFRSVHLDENLYEWPSVHIAPTWSHISPHQPQGNEMEKGASISLLTIHGERYLSHRLLGELSFKSLWYNYATLIIFYYPHTSLLFEGYKTFSVLQSE
ncbi:hypothetical protein Scep_024709 [Stephania cephalantha]|uniref:Uncharacterized protein n=1 Tax=Stephania cephalantha TaxID=152367 RepID=A0AAP0HYT9_9MAGN